MFNFGTGREVDPNISTGAGVKRSSRKAASVRASETPPPPDSLQPAMDGPPSPDRIRAYTEQMKRGSIGMNSSGSNTFSSTTSSLHSRDSSITSLSRKSSSRSNTSSMPSARGERPESVHLFGKSIFWKAGRRARREGNSLSISTSSPQSGSGERISAREHYYGKGSDVRKRQQISGPYNFQHVTHTKPDHVSKLENGSRQELASEFSAIRASQVPTKGELKGIRAQDLPFEKSSSEALDAPTGEHGTPQPSAQLESGSLRTALSPTPPRPPRPPLSLTCPIALPARTSSRTASILFDTFDPLATTTVVRTTPVHGGFRRPAPLGVLRPPPSPSWSEQQGDHCSDRKMSPVMNTPSHDDWPLTAPAGNFGELADVQEEEEDPSGPSRSRISTTSAELRALPSVDALHLSTSLNPERDSPNDVVTGPGSPLTPGCDLDEDWEKDVDYCYENELEADDDYQWVDNTDAAPQAHLQRPPLGLHLDDGHRSLYNGRCRPSLPVPFSYDIPELSPTSPDHLLTLRHARSPSPASSFKESHGFNLSPSLLIPSDFKAQMDQDILFEKHFRDHVMSGTMFVQEPYNQSYSPIEESSLSNVSYRSSDYSRGSARSSSSTRISGAHCRASRDSALLFSRALSINQAHRSIGSASSLPDLIPSSLRSSEQTTGLDVAACTGSSEIAEGDEVVHASPAHEVDGPTSGHFALPHRRIKSALEPGIRRGINHFVAPPPAVPEDEQPVNLSPVTECFVEIPGDDAQVDVNAPHHELVQAQIRDAVSANQQPHERKTSAPVLSPTVREFKGRARSATSGSNGVGHGKPRGSYTLFPQTQVAQI